MFISSQLRKALLISFLCHFCCFFFFSITFISGGLRKEKYASVNFLGSVLNHPVCLPQDFASEKNALTELPIQLDISSCNQLSQKPVIAFRATRRLFNPDSVIEIDNFANQRLFAASFTPAGSDYQRKVIFQPAFPKFPGWIQQDLSGTRVVFRVNISADGLVQGIISEQASGNPEIDALLARYINRWRFVPVSGCPQQWQTIHLDLDLL